MGLFYDLHVHSALSPCADNDMTPSGIAGFSKLSGADVVAIADHNSARNLPAAQKVCDFYGLKLLPAIETNTAEEIHLLCYLPTVEAALDMGEEIYKTLPDMPIDKEIWGEQLIVDEEDNIVGRLDRLLTLASAFDVYDMKRMAEERGGIAVPAHADKDSYSALSVMGFLPDDLIFSTIELAHPHKLEEYEQKRLIPVGLSTLTSSDAHSLQQLMRTPLPVMEEEHPLMRLIEKL